MSFTYSPLSPNKSGASKAEGEASGGDFTTALGAAFGSILPKDEEGEVAATPSVAGAEISAAVPDTSGGAPTLSTDAAASSETGEGGGSGTADGTQDLTSSLSAALGAAIGSQEGDGDGGADGATSGDALNISTVDVKGPEVNVSEESITDGMAAGDGSSGQEDGAGFSGQVAAALESAGVQTAGAGSFTTPTVDMTESPAAIPKAEADVADEDSVSPEGGRRTSGGSRFNLKFLFGAGGARDRDPLEEREEDEHEEEEQEEGQC